SAWLEALEEGVEAARLDELAVQEARDRARSIRSEAGRDLDALGRDLSHARGELERLAGRRIELQSEQELLHKQRRDMPVSEAKADALLWELAAVEESLKSQGARCDELELQLSQRQLRLTEEND